MHIVICYIITYPVYCVILLHIIKKSYIEITKYFLVFITLVFNYLIILIIIIFVVNIIVVIIIYYLIFIIK